MRFQFAHQQSLQRLIRFSSANGEEALLNTVREFWEKTWFLNSGQDYHLADICSPAISLAALDTIFVGERVGGE